MTLVKKQPGAQYPLVAVFTVDMLNDSMVNIGGTEKAFGTDDATTSDTVFDIMTPPPGSMVIGGVIKIKDVVVGPATSTVDIGDSDDLDRYTETGAIDLKDDDAPNTGFDMLGVHKIYDGSQKIRMTLLNDVLGGGAVTAGKFYVVIEMVLPDRICENLKTT